MTRKDEGVEAIRPHLATGFTWHDFETPHHELFAGRTWWDYYETLFEGVFVQLLGDQETSRTLAKQVRGEYLDPERWHLFDDALGALRYCHPRFANYVITNHVPEFRTLLDRLGITPYFQGVFNSADIGYEKPRREIFEYALGASRQRADGSIMIGDSLRADVAGARGVGMDSILVRSENRTLHRWSLNGLADLPEMIEAIEHTASGV